MDFANTTSACREGSTGAVSPEQSLRTQEEGGWPVTDDPVPGVSGLVDWCRLLTQGAPDPEWLLEPFLPAGRLVALVGEAKAGKSLFALEAALALATGRAFLDRASREPRRVLYLDYEMCDADLAERVEDMGYGPDDHESLAGRLAYYQSPNLPVLNSPAGAAGLLELVDHHRPDVVFVDTLQRVFDGQENDAEPFQELYRLAWMPLRRRGVTVCRLDHTGHTEKRRPRGSSSKGDDVDVAWTLKATAAGIRLVRQASRMQWVPDSIDVLRCDDPPLHRLAGQRALPPGAAEWADVLDQLDAPDNLGERKLRTWLNEACRLAATSYQRAPRGEVLRAAMKLRAERTRPRLEVV